MKISVDPSTALGPVKPVNGVGQPPFTSPVQFPMFRYLREAGVPFSRRIRSRSFPRPDTASPCRRRWVWLTKAA